MSLSSPDERPSHRGMQPTAARAMMGADADGRRWLAWGKAMNQILPSPTPEQPG
jgi:hypothetical protein